MNKSAPGSLVPEDLPDPAAALIKELLSRGLFESVRGHLARKNLDKEVLRRSAIYLIQETELCEESLHLIIDIIIDKVEEEHDTRP